jgi:predicted dehydrogenase
MKRRIFLRNTLTTTAGAIVIPTIIPSYVIGQNPPGDKINIGVIGCGRIARDHNLPEILNYDVAKVIAVCDLDSKRLADGKKIVEDYYAKKTGSSNYIDVKMYEDYRMLLANPSIDAVII